MQMPFMTRSHRSAARAVGSPSPDTICRQPALAEKSPQGRWRDVHNVEAYIGQQRAVMETKRLEKPIDHIAPGVAPDAEFGREK
jgi:hypothetical protein